MSTKSVARNCDLLIMFCCDDDDDDDDGGGGGGGVQVLCASVVHQPTFYQDDLVRNYLQFAQHRFSQLNCVRQRQFEMIRRLSTDFNSFTHL